MNTCGLDVNKDMVFCAISMEMIPLSRNITHIRWIRRLHLQIGQCHIAVLAASSTKTIIFSHLAMSEEENSFLQRKARTIAENPDGQFATA